MKSRRPRGVKKSETISPLVIAGGYVHGTFVTMALLPISPRMSQKGRPSRDLELTGMSGSSPEPFLRSRNSKMPCLPGFLPVIHETHAVGVIGGIDVSSSPLTPSSVNSFNRGINPLLIKGSSRSKVAPSSPMNKTFLLITKDLGL